MSATTEANFTLVRKCQIIVYFLLIIANSFTEGRRKADKNLIFERLVRQKSIETDLFWWNNIRLIVVDKEIEVKKIL